MPQPNTAPPAAFPVISSGKPYVPLDLSSANETLQMLGLERYLAQTLPIDEIGYGGYLEHRTFYLRSPLFQGDTRTLHLGVDLWAPAGTPVYAPFDGTIHSLADNNQYLDYGPTIILRHNLSDGSVLHTLYGHLSRESLADKKVGQPIKAGDHFCWFGDAEENGNWPPHLHLQCIRDMQGKTGDYPGVVAPEQKTYYATNCPDPTPLIGLS